METAQEHARYLMSTAHDVLMTYRNIILRKKGLYDKDQDELRSRYKPRGKLI